MRFPAWLLSPWLSIRVQLGLGAIFLVAAIPKIADPPAFAHAIYNYHLLPGTVINAMALVLPWVELLTGIALLAGVWKRTAAGITGFLLLVFLVALSVSLARGNPVNCACFDVHAKEKSRAALLDEMRWTILRDVAILAMAGQVLATSNSERRAA
jgi:uncharacterized membrane protein YphA (DoxX/SURF4 family)